MKGVIMTSKLTLKTTIYLEPRVKKFVQLMALQKSKSISQFINDQFDVELRKFESVKTGDGKTPATVAEWLIVRAELDKSLDRKSVV